MDELLRLLRAASQEPDAGLAAAVRWLGQEMSAEAALFTGGGMEAATDGFPYAAHDALRPVLGRLAQGELTSAATELTLSCGPVPVRLIGLGGDVPHPVLAIAGPTAHDRSAARLAASAGGLLSVLHRAREAEAARLRYRRKAYQVRLSIFLALMTGNPQLARRITGDAVPPLLKSERLRIGLLHCDPGDRDRLAATYEDAAGYHDGGLLVRCPLFDNHLICLVVSDRLEKGLRALVRDTPHYALGVSAPLPLTATAEAYEQASHALTVARSVPDRIVEHQPTAQLVGVLESDATTAWARDLLRPLAEEPWLTTEAIRLGLQFRRVGVARLLGVSRNTLAAHIRRAEAALRTDLRCVRNRATLTLAFALLGGGPVRSGRAADEGRDANGAPPGQQVPLPPLPAAASAAGGAWAREFLAPLRRETPSRDLLGTVRAWVAANTDAQEAARRLGVSRATVRARLRATECLLKRDLLSGGMGVYELVHAVYLADELPA